MSMSMLKVMFGAYLVDYLRGLKIVLQLFKTEVYYNVKILKVYKVRRSWGIAQKEISVNWIGENMVKTTFNYKCE